MLLCLLYLAAIIRISRVTGLHGNSTDGTDEECDIRGSCLRREPSTADFNKENCHCDEQCVVYRDCCPDYIPSNTHQKQLIAKESLSCVPIQRPGGTFPGSKPHERIYLVTRCPGSFSDEEVRDLCEDPLDDALLSVPVSDLSTNIVYGNYFCALCHGVKNPEFWNVAVKCYGKVTSDVTIGSLQMALQLPQHKCSRYFEQPNENVTTRPCQHTRELCPDNWSSSQYVVDQCANHINYVYHSSTVYRNKFCALCYGVQEEELTCDPPDIVVVFHSDRDWRPPSFRVIMDLNSGLVGIEQKSVSTEEQTFRRRCPDRNVYDPFLGFCRPLTCPPGQRLAPNSALCVRKVIKQDNSGLAHRNPALDEPQGTRDLPVENIVNGNHTTCAKIGYNSSEYILWDNGTILIHGKPYQPEEYTVVDDVVYVCRPDVMTNNYTVIMNITSDNIRLNYDKIESILTVIGLTISLICLTLTIVVHSVYPALRNTAGKCIIGLSVSLFIGQLLFLTATKAPNHVACYTFAVVLHYAFLASFCWTNCLSIDICLAFSTSRGFNGSGTNRFRTYFFYACGVPVFFVLLSILLDFIPSVPDLYRPHYGDYYCLINRSDALLVVFALPVACILSANFVLFVITTKNIYVSKKVAKFAMVEKRRNAKVLDFILYTKLYVIMGLTWLIGFLAATVDERPLWYVFIIFNTLQGAFLCFAFVFTKKTAKLFRERSTSWTTTSTKMTSRPTSSRTLSDTKLRESF